MGSLGGCRFDDFYRNDFCDLYIILNLVSQLMNHADHSTFEHLIHMLLCCIAGLGIGTLAVWGYTKIKESKNHNP